MKKSKYPKKSGLGAVFYQVFIRVSWVVGNVSMQHVEYLITFFISFHMSYITLIDYIDINLVSFLFFFYLWQIQGHWLVAKRAKRQRILFTSSSYDR